MEGGTVAGCDPFGAVIGVSSESPWAFTLFFTSFFRLFSVVMDLNVGQGLQSNLA